MQVAELSGRLSTLQMSLQMNVQREFELLGTSEDKANVLLLERLKSCCMVVDALGYKVGLGRQLCPGTVVACSSLKHSTARSLCKVHREPHGHSEAIGVPSSCMVPLLSADVPTHLLQCIIGWVCNL